jgi:hypothetical protein
MKVLGIGAAGLGAGVLGRSIAGIPDLLRSKKKTDIPMTSTVPQALPVRVHRKKPKPAPSQAYDSSYEEDELEKVSQSGDPYADWGWFNANDAGGPTWWQIPAGLALGAGGVAGGWAGIDKLLEAKKKRDADADLAKARQSYHQALSDQYQSTMMSKGASDDNLAADLDRLYDHMEKKAEGSLWDQAVDTGKNFGHIGAGTYAAMLLATALGSGYAGYKWTKGKSKNKIIQDALARRARERTAPQPIYAQPDYIDVDEPNEEMV